MSTAVADTGAGVAMPVELWMELRNQNGASVGTFYGRRMMSTAAEMAVAEQDQEEENSVGKVAKSDSGAVVLSYWGIDRPKIKREDGSEWPRNCFMPWETYKPNISIDLTKHHKPTAFLDKFAYWTVKTLRVPTAIFFQSEIEGWNRLETVAGEKIAKSQLHLSYGRKRIWRC